MALAEAQTRSQGGLAPNPIFFPQEPLLPLNVEVIILVCGASQF